LIFEIKAQAVSLWFAGAFFLSVIIMCVNEKEVVL